MYRFIYDAGVPVSKQQISTALSYSLPTVHQNIAELLEAGLIRPGEVQKSTGGRPAVGYTINESIRCSVGIAVSATQLRILATDVRQNELAYDVCSLSSADGAQIGQQIAEKLEHFLGENHIEKERVLGVGITFPGVIDQEKDVIVLISFKVISRKLIVW